MTQIKETRSVTVTTIPRFCLDSIGLFGLFDHEIPFHEGESVAIVHGPNGFGKTVMLKMIGAIVSGESAIFNQVPFSEFWLEFDDGSQRRAVRTSSSSEGGSTSKTSFSQISADGVSIEIPELPPPSKELLDYVDRFVGMARFRDGWRDSRGHFVSLNEVLSEYPGIRERLPDDFRAQIDAPTIEGFSVFFVETNRLLASSDKPVRPERYYRVEYARDLEEVRPLRVVQYSSEIIKRVQAVLANYAKNSQERDRTFPERLVHFLRTNQPALSEKEILSQMADLEVWRQRLINLGFIDAEQGLSDLTEDDVNRAKEALTIYVGDVREKLKVFDEMAVRVGMLIDIVNERFNYKRLSIDREHGFHLRSRADSTMNLANLSSGEQHELILLYELLFMVPKNGLVLIDEPEISLHVAWQSRFLNDLLGVLKITGAQALIATHAPAIIGNRWDLAVRLTGAEGVVEDATDVS